MSFGSRRPSDPLPWAEATGHRVPSDEAGGGGEAEPGTGSAAPSAPPGPGVCAPGGAAPCVTCEITSETVMAQPADRARRIVGVGERVRLTFSLGNANWTSSGGRLSSNAGTTVVFTAPATPEQVTFTATGGGCTANFSLEVIAPNDVRMRRVDVLHMTNSPSIGMHTQIFFLPDTVNFHRTEFDELEIGATADGVFACKNHGGHSPNPNPLPATATVRAGFGTRIDARDQIWSGFCNPSSTMGAGHIHFAIPWRYRVRGSGAFHRFSTVHQRHSSTAAGALRASKAQAHTPPVNHADPGQGTLNTATGPVAIP